MRQSQKWPLLWPVKAGERTVDGFDVLVPKIYEALRKLRLWVSSSTRRVALRDVEQAVRNSGNGRELFS